MKYCYPDQVVRNNYNRCKQFILFRPYWFHKFVLCCVFGLSFAHWSKRDCLARVRGFDTHPRCPLIERECKTLSIHCTRAVARTKQQQTCDYVGLVVVVYACLSRVSGSRGTCHRVATGMRHSAFWVPVTRMLGCVLGALWTHYNVVDVLLRVVPIGFLLINVVGKHVGDWGMIGRTFCPKQMYNYVFMILFGVHCAVCWSYSRRDHPKMPRFQGKRKKPQKDGSLMLVNHAVLYYCRYNWYNT